MPIRVDDDVDEVGIVESARRSVEGRVVERPFWRPHAPQEARDPSSVLLETPPATLAVEVVLIPERRLFGRARRLHRMRDALDVVRIAGDERDDPVRQKRCDDARSAPAPIVAAENCALDFERVHEVEKVHAEGCLLARARRLGFEEPRRTVAAQIRHDHARPGLRKDRRGLIIGVGVVREAVTQDARPARRGSIFQISDGKNAGVNRLDDCRHGSPSSFWAALGSTFMRGQRPLSQRLDAASGFPYYPCVFNSRRRVAKLIVPLALEDGQT